MMDVKNQFDRELDLLVAEKVMKIVSCDMWTETNLGSAGGPALLKNCFHESCYSTLEIGSLLGTIGGCPRYSSQINIAWEVVHRMNSLGYELTLISGNGGEEWFACFRKITIHGTEPPNNTSDVQKSRGSAAKAICLAALRALSPGDSNDEAGLAEI